MCIRISLDQEVDHNDPGEISDGDDDVVELAPWRWKNIYDMVHEHRDHSEILYRVTV